MITFEHDRVVARPREGERGCESRYAAPGDDELHTRKPSGCQTISKELACASADSSSGPSKQKSSQTRSVLMQCRGNSWSEPNVSPAQRDESGTAAGVAEACSPRVARRDEVTWRGHHMSAPRRDSRVPRLTPTRPCRQPRPSRRPVLLWLAGEHPYTDSNPSKEMNAWCPFVSAPQASEPPWR
jgi:hypothetical protein